MRVIVNSDILFSPRLVVATLSKRLQEFFRACAQKGAIVVIPTTALLEYNRAQSTLVVQEKNRLELAYSTLNGYGVTYQRISPEEVISMPDLPALARSLGATVEVEEPTIEDFHDGHRRACLHENPHPPTIKSDEMRDLVIWAIALRLAGRDGGAILLSNDEVHKGPLGSEEADKHFLVRVDNLEDALDYLGVETIPRQLFIRLLEPIWTNILQTRVPLPESLTDLRLLSVEFIQGITSPSVARAAIKATVPRLTANIIVNSSDDVVTSVDITDITIEGNVWEMGAVTVVPTHPIATG